MINQVTEKVFKETKGVSYSRLSKLAESPQAYQAGLVDDPESSAISIGSAVDIKLTEPDKFDEQIYVMSAKKPSAEPMLKFVNGLVNNAGNSAVAWTQSGYKISIDAVMKKFDNEGGREYHDALLAAKGKQILDVEDLFKVNQLVTTLQTNPFTKKYFVPEDGVELIFQPRILWDLPYVSLLEEGKTSYVQAKSVLDVIRIDHKNKIIQPVDLKTGAESFMKSYWRYKRYLQGAMYDTAMYHASCTTDKEGNVYPSNYIIENIRFVFADTNLWYPPRIYQMTDNDIRVGIHGSNHQVFINAYDKNGKSSPEISGTHTSRVKGYAQLAAELEWHQKMDKWDYSYDVYQKNGEVDIDAFTFKF
jgi:hypothetical protein